MSHTVQSNRQQRVLSLLESGQRLTGLSLTLKLFSSDVMLPAGFSHHTTPACKMMKERRELSCAEFVFRNILVEVPALPEGRIHTCPHGFTEIAVPVSRDGVVYGVLLGGQCWREETPPPSEDLIVPEDETWLEDRRHMLLCMAGEIGRLLLRSDPSDARSDQIRSFVQSHHHRSVTIRELARELHLSPSRARHVVRECFGVSFTSLVNNFRLERAAELLESTNLPVVHIGDLVGIPDQSYLTRLFTRRYRISPRRYRIKQGAPPAGEAP